MEYQHLPVLLEEVIEWLITDETRVFLDCTLGEGGHSQEILRRFPAVTVYGLDRDGAILDKARNRLSIFQDRIFTFQKNFRDISADLFKDVQFDAVLIDLGISVYHYKESGRGFSFLKREKLDMRLDHEAMSVFDIINQFSEREIAEILWKYGDERFSRKIASRIIKARSDGTIEYSDQLAEIISAAIPVKFHPKHVHPATKSFQALRIFSNTELDNIKEGIPKVISMIKKGGRLGVITFHSLEDRIVKNLLRDLSKDCVCPPGTPVCICGKKSIVKILSRAVKATEEEVKNNPPSRSAQLRVVEKL